MVLHKKKTSKKKAPSVIHNVYILDASGSMAGPKYNSAVAGIRQEMAMLQKSKEHVIFTQTIIEFSGGGWPGDHLGTRYMAESRMSHGTMKPIEDYPFNPMGTYGNTPLYKTTGEVLEQLMALKKRKDRVLVKVFTDGRDNASQYSKYHNPIVLKQLIDELQERHGFTIAFIGTELDIEALVRDVGVDIGNTYVHNDTARGITHAFGETISATVAYSKEVARGVDPQLQKGKFYRHATAGPLLDPDKIR